MRLFAFFVIGLSACVSRAPQMRTDLIARSQAPVFPAAPSPTIDLTAGTYDLALRFTVPRAQQVTWVVRCADGEDRGVAGETWEQYRTRRLAEMAREAQPQRNTLTVVGNARVRTPIGTIDARAQEAAVAVETPPPPTELPPDDIGQGVFMGHARFSTSANGPCAIAIEAEDPNVAVTFDITRQVDLQIEAEKQRLAAANVARNRVRGQLVVQLTAGGADPDALAKREAAEREAELARERERTRRAEELEATRAAERARRAKIEMERAEEQARLDAIKLAEIEKRRAEHQAKLDEERRKREAIEAREKAERRAQAERERIEIQMKIERERKIRLEIELRIRRRVMETRTLLVGYLYGTCGADPNAYARMKAQEELEIELRMRLEIEERERRELAYRVHQQRLAAVRGDLRAYLQDIGARERPARPEPRPENRGTSPFDNGVWIAGEWTWSETDWAWSWTAGWWKDRTSFGDAGQMERDMRGVATVDVSAQDPDPVVVETAPPVVVVKTPPPPPPVKTTTTTTTVIVQPPSPPPAVIVTTPTITIQTPTITIKPGVRDHRKVRVKSRPSRR